MIMYLNKKIHLDCLTAHWSLKNVEFTLYTVGLYKLQYGWIMAKVRLNWGYRASHWLADGWMGLTLWNQDFIKTTYFNLNINSTYPRSVWLKKTPFITVVYLPPLTVVYPTDCSVSCSTFLLVPISSYARGIFQRILQLPQLSLIPVKVQKLTSTNWNVLTL